MYTVNRILTLQSNLTTLMVVAILMVGFSTANASHNNLKLFSDAELFAHQIAPCPADAEACVFEFFPQIVEVDALKCPGEEPVFPDQGCSNSERHVFFLSLATITAVADCKGKKCNVKVTTFTEEGLVDIINQLPPSGLNVPTVDDDGAICFAIVPRRARFLVHLRACADKACTEVGRIVSSGVLDFDLFLGTIEELGCREDKFFAPYEESCPPYPNGSNECTPLF